jgi:hypothetical protein
MCRGARGYAARFEDDYAVRAPWQIKQYKWNPGRFAGAGWGFDHEAGIRQQTRAHLGQYGVDW